MSVLNNLRKSPGVFISVVSLNNAFLFFKCFNWKLLNKSNQTNKGWPSFVISANIFSASWWTCSLRCLNTVFHGKYLPSLSINCVAINKDLKKMPPQLYYVKMNICLIWSRLQWHRSRNEMTPLFMFLAAVFPGTANRSRELFPSIAASMFLKLKHNLWEHYRDILVWSFHG